MGEKPHEVGTRGGGLRLSISHHTAITIPMRYRTEGTVLALIFHFGVLFLSHLSHYPGRETGGYA